MVDRPLERNSIVTLSPLNATTGASCRRSIIRLWHGSGQPGNRIRRQLTALSPDRMHL
jgi:hypothetical protein